ncbi:hypothetical protein OB919_12320 [Halobacteria archaeon AArc-curdl1]|uniref:Uncharacterized protein n=1 Tax=Natronosalvus hydrolyticus TaxID=2979988 RepID=A0AAP2Z9M2_9EURY|nr:hypothetical protein [Halobacteria archaeon AArc-curdl1]
MGLSDGLTDVFAPEFLEALLVLAIVVVFVLSVLGLVLVLLR